MLRHTIPGQGIPAGGVAPHSNTPRYSRSSRLAIRAPPRSGTYATNPLTRDTSHGNLCVKETGVSARKPSSGRNGPPPSGGRALTKRRAVRLVSQSDCGAAVSPDRCRAQSREPHVHRLHAWRQRCGIAGRSGRRPIRLALDTSVISTNRPRQPQSGPSCDESSRRSVTARYDLTEERTRLAFVMMRELEPLVER